MKERILSGMRPTGPLHLGHLAGALTNWIELQKKHECLFMVADWHALMSEYEAPSDMADYALDNILDWLSCGIDPERSVVFIQSEVSEHLELSMFLSCITPLGWLERCPTYKEQLREITERDLSTYAFLGYPVLQAADILLYKAGAVPVGEDQLPHLELTREIARRFNSLYGKVLLEPKAILTSAPRLLGIDGRKMSKSYNNFIALRDKPDAIKKKVMQMITDPARIKLTDKGHPDVCSVFSYYKTFAAPDAQKDCRDWCENAKKGCTECKQIMAAVLAERLAPIQKEREKLKKVNIRKILDDGAKRAHEIAAATMREVKSAVFKASPRIRE